MIFNWFGAYFYIYIYKGVKRKQINAIHQRLLLYFSLIFVSNIVTGNWSLGLVSITFNQAMRALVPGLTVVLSMVMLGKEYSSKRKLSLVPVTYGLYLACIGDTSCTIVGFLMTVVAVLFAALKVVLSSEFSTGELKLHPVDLILHQAPLSAFWCFVAIFMTGE